jgi:hypothetical protein
MQNSLTCFGVGDGFPCADRSHAAFLYRCGTSSILVDCGEPVDGSYQASGMSYDLFDSIFISHLHADHIGGFLMLMQGCWLQGRRKALPVHVPAGAIRPLQNLLEAALLPKEWLQFRLGFRPLTARKPVRVGDLRVTPFPTSHLDMARAELQRHCRAGIFVSYCFLLESARLRIGHSADLGKPQDLDPLLAKPLDLLVCEIAHFTPEEIFSYLRQRPVRRVVFVHLARDYWTDLP